MTTYEEISIDDSIDSQKSILKTATRSVIILFEFI